MHGAAVLPAFVFAAELLNPFSLTKRDNLARAAKQGYAPTTGRCPPGVAVRQGTALDPGEAAYIQGKTVASPGDWRSYLNTVGLEDFDAASFVPPASGAVPGKTVPVVSFILAGGGARAMLVGAGMMAAMDGRNSSAVRAKTGGIFQLGQYFSGVSGGSFLTGSAALASFPPFEYLRDNLWNMEKSLWLPQVANPAIMIEAVSDIGGKALAGSPISVADAYGRLLMYNVISDKALAPAYESTPFTFATNIPSSGGLSVPIEYLGTNFNYGVPSSTSKCVTGFENAGFLMACSGTAFGVPAQMAAGYTGMMGLLDNPFLKAVLSMVPDADLLTGRIVNPFRGMGSLSGYPAAEDQEIKLVDGASGGESLPFFPIMKPSRNVDIVVVLDASDLQFNFCPDGTYLRNSYLKSLQPGYPKNFPFIPTPQAFVKQGLHKRPGFFGSACYSQENEIVTPTFIYLPNYKVNFETCTSPGDIYYSKEAQQGFFNNEFAIVTQGPSSTWPICMACALVDAQQARNGRARTSQCQACFMEYCYMGKQ